MAQLLKQSSTAQPLQFLLVSSTDHVTPVTGLGSAPVATLSKNGASFAAASGAVSEVGNGWYKVAGNATDTGTLGALIVHATGTGADPADREYEVVSFDPQNGVNAGLTAFPNIATGNAGALLVDGTGTGAISNSAGKVLLQATQTGVTIPTVSAVTGAVGSVTGAVGSVTGNVGGNLSGNVNGSVVGSVASVTGSVGSVSGSVGSVTGDIGGKVLGGGSSSITGDGVRASSVTGSVASVTGAVGSVSGAVGSVTGNVGGNVSGKVLGGGSGTITGDGVRASSVTGTVGSVTGAVGSVTGDIGGNLTGNVVGRVLGGGSTAFTGIGAQVDLEEMGGIPDGVAGLSLLGVDYASGDLEGNVASQVWAWPSSLVTTAGSMGVLIKDQPTTIWSVPLPGSFASGTAGNILGNLTGGGGGDPWATHLPGAYTNPQAGYLLGNMSVQWLTMTQLDGSVWQFTATALDLAPSGGGGLSGPVAFTVHTQDSLGAAVAFVDFTVVGQGPGRTDASGNFTGGLPAVGSYVISGRPTDGLLFASFSGTINNAQTVDLIGTAPVIPTPTDPNTAIGYVYMRDRNGAIVTSGATLTYTLVSGPGADGASYATNPGTATSDGTGLLTITGPCGAAYNVERGDGLEINVVFPNTSETFAMPEVLGMDIS